VLVGVSDPTDLFAYDEIARLLKKGVELAVVNETEVLQAIDRIYRRTGEITGLARELEQDLGDSNSVDFGALASNSGLEEAPVVKLLQSVFDDAAQVRASDIHIEPQDGRLQIRFRIDGVLHLQTEADIKIATPLALRLKLMADLDISEKRLPQDGRFAVKVKNQRIDVRISTMPTQYGESVVMRLLNQVGMNLAPRCDRHARAWWSASAPSSSAQRPGAGDRADRFRQDHHAVQRAGRAELGREEADHGRGPGRIPPARHQPGAGERQDRTEFRARAALGLRQDPDIVLVGEMRDQETAQIGLRAAMTGHLVLSTLHTNDAASTPLRLMDMGVPRYMVGGSLQAVLAQRLVRVICESCSQPYAAPAPERAWLRAELGDRAESVPLFHGRGCSHCNGTGYRGRTGVYELLEMTRAVHEAINHPDPATS
jgi:MSHA biogenesis protein MshE